MTIDAKKPDLPTMVNNHIRDYVLAMDILINDRTIPAFDGYIDEDSDVAEIEEYEQELAQFLDDNGLPSDWTAEQIEENEGKYFIDGNVYEDSNQWINAEFLDWGYHRFHGEINVIQCLTMHGGPTGGFWIEEDSSIQYWVGWGFEEHTTHLSGSDYTTVKAFFESEFECHCFEFNEHCGFEIDDQWGFDGALQVLRMARLSSEFEEEESEEGGE